ncbi:MAG: hypothetical protein ACXVEI_13885, partial [Actinomycetota bacterium]
PHGEERTPLTRRWGRCEERKETSMDGNTDKGKGRMKKAIGRLTGDKNLKRDGRLDARARQTKQNADAIDVANDKLEEVAETLGPDGWVS